MIENNETSNQANQKTGESSRIVYKGVKTFSESKAGKATAELGKEALMWLIKAFASIIASISLPLLIAIIAVLIAAISVFSFSLDVKDFDIDKSFGEACDNESSDTYKKIENNYKVVVGKARDEIKDHFLVESSYDEVKKAFNSLTISYKDNMPTFSSHIDGKEVKSETEEYEYEVDIKIPLNSNVDKQMIDTIVGYIQANYGAASLFTGDELEDINDSTVQKKFKSLKFGDLTPDTKEVMDEAYCKNVDGRIRKERSGNYCDYYYTPEKIENIVSGTCEYNNGSWENKGSEEHECSTEEWAKKVNNEKKKPDNNIAPKDGDKYKYTVSVTIDNTKNPLENFKLDNYRTEIKKYIDSGKLFYYNSEKLNSELKNRVSIKTTTSTRTENRKKEVTLTNVTCTYNVSKKTWEGDKACSFISGEGSRGEKRHPKKTENYKVTITKNIHTISVVDGNALNVTIQTGVDNSSDGFLSEEKKKAIKNIQATGIHKSTGFNNAEYLYDKAVYDMADTINTMCPNNKINLSLLTGSTYSSFSAITGAVNAPEVFGNSAYWYDSSKGVWDETQLRRQDVYNAIWSYAAYTYQTAKVGNVSGWLQNGKQVGTPQCTDFVHTRFYAQYGFDCGYGNGQDIASNTVNMYPDKFTSGSIMGDLTIKAGSIISKRGGDYGHVGFVEAIETNDSNKIVSITISDANFTFPGCGGGVRLMCKYTWEQFVQAWGLNCTFAVPIN